MAGKANKPASKRTVYRSSINGTFVTKGYAAKHKPTTEKEIVP